ncbi:MAG TPA: ribosome small subunit-dependent GTPase A [Gemmatimonadaceae bacterium]|nr:ribosome small subunit-dependent GTPase A [Gemmatimonadaceae bacterium]
MTSPRRTQGIVLRGTGGVWQVRTETGETCPASLRGRLKQGEHEKLAVGDDVVVERDERDDAWTIVEILPRRSKLARRAPGGGPGERVVAANLDQVVVVFAIAEPEPHVRMLDRFLVIAEANDLASRVVVNKVELAPGDTHLFAEYEKIGYPVHYTSVKRGDGLSELKAALRGRVSALTGPSGVGKSSLLNAMFPGLNLRVGEISRSVMKGRHTTVGADLHPLPESGYVVDTPGLREVGLWGLDAREVDRCFPEMRPLLEQCRFGDCTHRVEPGCAVREGVEATAVSRDRYESYLKLRKELEEASRVF